MTVFKQRFKRWNFFFVNGMFYNMAYIFGSWKLGWAEIGAKIFVFQEVYETLLYLVSPFILPISFIVRPSFAGILLASTVVMVNPPILFTTAKANPSAVPNQHGHLQRSPPPPQKRTPRLGPHLRLLPSLQDRSHRRQRGQLLLVALQVRALLRKAPPQGD